MRLAIPIAVGALALTACGSDDGGGGGNGADGPTYKIAFQGPLSGPNAALGENMGNAVELAIDEANESGDYEFTLEYMRSDDRGEEGEASSAAQLVIDDEDVIAVVGPAFSGAAAVAAPRYGQAGIPAVTSSATRADLTQQGWPTFLRAVPNDSAQGAGMAAYLAAQAGVEKVVVIDDTQPYGVGLADVAQEGLEDAGLEVVRQSVPNETPDYTSAARNVVTEDADALIYAGYYSDAGPFAVKLEEQGFEGIQLAGDGVMDGEFLDLAGSSAANWFFTCPCTSAEDDEATQGFAERFEDKYSQAPGVYSAESYDVTSMIIAAIAALGDDAESGALYDHLVANEYEGLTKTFAFDEQGEFTNQTIFLYEAEGEGFDYLGSVEDLTTG
ncbi:branched-chain amino acid ABC transporter substrate-binding protein [Streptomyces sp. ACA25]|uniref:branched-chain amino acid ABC transporter substrate-binding protein n=1 Tax=Streptomyces sp. ACA25 TaxID=3022596 RepID=UPI0023077272|nr:branched-chain amino acid ABC transporter substrate-binding protein [Streptomyces sp. ACA25]MDB1088583.1 branched-chain amino acid ABC transporter substrate-binding protein [Streptomyces sp. ACA25]